jgi:predicted glycoside hydrolase/deacetylase ChbG (UPF0249 family)
MTPKQYIQQNMAIIVADDFAMSGGTDSAITELLFAKKLHFTSALVTSERFDDIDAKTLPQGVVGLHFDLTFGKAISIVGKSIITDENGNFDKSFAQIMLLCVIKKKQMQALISREVKAQLQKLHENFGEITHIDGHQHIHMNPLIFREIQKYAKEFGVPRIRFINEKILQKMAFFPSNFANSIKLILLRFLGFFCNYKSETYFVSILHTCKISKEILANYQVPKGFDNIEIMLHPSNSHLDFNTKNKEKSHLLSPFREIEKNSLEN